MTAGIQRQGAALSLAAASSAASVCSLDIGESRRRWPCKAAAEEVRRRWRRWRRWQRARSLPLHLCFTRMDGMRRGEKEEILLLLCDGGGGWDVKRLLRWCFALPYLVAAFVKSRRCFMMIMATLKLIL